MDSQQENGGWEHYQRIVGSLMPCYNFNSPRQQPAGEGSAHRDPPRTDLCWRAEGPNDTPLYDASKKNKQCKTG